MSKTKVREVFVKAQPNALLTFAGEQDATAFGVDCEPKNERYMPHKIEQPNVAVKALGDNELADWVERIASAPNIGLLDEYKSYLRECAARMKERGRRLKNIEAAFEEEVRKQWHCRNCEWRGRNIRSEPACPCPEDEHQSVFEIDITDRLMKVLGDGKKPVNGCHKLEVK